MNPAHLRVLIGYDLRYSLRSAKGLLFLVFYGVIWFWLLWQLSSGAATWLADPEGNMVAAWFLQAELAQQLFQQRPPTLSAYFLIALSMVPVFAIWSACDQTASDLASGHLRFLVPRCGRSDVYIARFVSAAILLTAAEILTGFAAMLISLAVDNWDVTGVIMYAIRISAIIVIYSLPFVALMALLSALTASAGLAALVGICVYTLVTVASAFLSVRFPEAELFSYILPNALKSQMIAPDSAAFIALALALMLYLLIYLSAGWYLFQRRDL